MFGWINGHLLVDYFIHNVKRDYFLLVSSDFHVRSSTRLVTHDLLWYRYLTNVTPLC